MKTNDNEQKAIVGEKIASAFGVKFNKKTGYYQTGYGNKSAIGVFNMLESISAKVERGDFEDIN